MPKTKLCENKEAARCNYVAGMIVGGLRRGNIETDTASRKVECLNVHCKTSCAIPEVLSLGNCTGLQIWQELPLVYSIRIFQNRGRRLENETDCNIRE
jgi:hypothetical protein